MESASHLGEGCYYYMVPLAAFFEADLEEVQEIVAVPLTILLLFSGIRLKPYSSGNSTRKKIM